LALWGDSQAEGMCVNDDEKIAAFVARLSAKRIEVLPFARSGDDCNDWIPQIAAIANNSEDPLSIDAHLFLLVEWTDWCVDLDDTKEVFDESMNAISGTLPAFVIQTARNVLTTGDASQMRKLRFRPGPVTTRQVAMASDLRDDPDSISLSMLDKLSKQLDRLRRQGQTPCIFLYAPMVPTITGGEIRFEDPDEVLFERFRDLCVQNRFDVIDLRGKMKSAVLSGEWPRGFQNGQFGVGHYNANGNRIIAQNIIAQSLLTILDTVQSNDSAIGRHPSRD